MNPRFSLLFASDSVFGLLSELMATVLSSLLLRRYFELSSLLRLVVAVVVGIGLYAKADQFIHVFSRVSPLMVCTIFSIFPFVLHLLLLWYSFGFIQIVCSVCPNECYLHIKEDALLAPYK